MKISRGLIGLLGVLCLAVVIPHAALATSVSIPDAVLANSFNFYKFWGPAILTSRTDLPGPGVEFFFTGIGSSGSGVKDDYAIDPAIGGTGHGNGDLTSFANYTMYFFNKSATALAVSLIMNTGFTGGSGNPPNNANNDTFWTSDWVTVNRNTWTKITLDFDHAKAYNGSNNRDLPYANSPHGLYSEGGWYAIQHANDLAEVSAIGFEVAYWGGSSVAGDLIVSSVPLPPTLLLLGSGLLGLIGLRGRRRGFFKGRHN